MSLPAAGISFEARYANMKAEYRKLQQELTDLRRQVAEVCRSYDGHRSVDLWDEDLIASKEWTQRLDALASVVDPPKFPERKRSRRMLLHSKAKAATSGDCQKR